MTMPQAAGKNKPGLVTVGVEIAFRVNYSVLVSLQAFYFLQLRIIMKIFLPAAQRPVQIEAKKHF